MNYMCKFSIFICAHTFEVVYSFSLSIINETPHIMSMQVAYNSSCLYQVTYIQAAAFSGSAKRAKYKLQ